jgi:tetrahydromethanopterin S-methyltransferase subunit F
MSNSHCKYSPIVNEVQLKKSFISRKLQSGTNANQIKRILYANRSASK